MNEERRARIERKLRERLDASEVRVIDDSAAHAGHAGATSGAGHFRAFIVSDRFEGLSRVAAQRLVYASIEDEMGTEIHALSIRTSTPGEGSSQAD